MSSFRITMNVCVKQTCFSDPDLLTSCGQRTLCSTCPGSWPLYLCKRILQTAGRVAVRTEWNDRSMLEFFLAILGFPTLSSVLKVYWEKLRCPGGAPCSLALQSRVQSRSRKQFRWEPRNVAAFLGSFVSYLYHLPPRGHTGATVALLIHFGLIRGLRGCGIIWPAWPTRSLQIATSLRASLWLLCGHWLSQRVLCLPCLLQGAKIQVKAT